MTALGYGYNSVGLRIWLRRLIFAAGNEYAGNPAFPGAYSKCVCVSSLAADFTPACYTDFGSLVTLSAPGGD